MTLDDSDLSPSSLGADIIADHLRPQWYTFPPPQWSVIRPPLTLEGTSAYRGGMNALLSRLVRQSKQEVWNILLIHSIDRLSRHGVVQTVRAVTRLADAGIRLTSYREADTIDLSSPHGELVLSVFAFLAKQESAIKSERAKRGIENARAKGVRIGRPPGSKDKRKRTRRYFREPLGG